MKYQSSKSIKVENTRMGRSCLSAAGAEAVRWAGDTLALRRGQPTQSQSLSQGLILGGKGWQKFGGNSLVWVKNKSTIFYK